MGACQYAFPSTRAELKKCIFLALEHPDKATRLIDNLAELYLRAPSSAGESIDSTDQARLLDELVPDTYRSSHWKRIYSVLEQAMKNPELIPESFVASLLQKRNHFGQQPLHILIDCGAPAEAIQVALDAGADPDATCYIELPVAGPVGEVTPLHLAVAKNQLKTIERLLANQATVDPVSELNETPFEMHIKGSPHTLDIELISLFVKCGARISEHSRETLIPALVHLAQNDFTRLKSFLSILPVQPPPLEQKYEVLSGRGTKTVDYFDFVDHLVSMAKDVDIPPSDMSRLLWKHLVEQMPHASPDEPDAETDDALFPLTEEDEPALLSTEPALYGDSAVTPIVSSDSYFGSLPYIPQTSREEIQTVRAMLSEGGSMQDIYNLFRSIEAFEEFFTQTSRGLDTDHYSEPQDFPFTKLLQPLLFRFSPGLTNNFAQFVESRMDRLSNRHGWHPYIAEMMALLNHPRDEKRDNSSLGALTSSLSSVTRLIRYRVGVTGQMVYDWGRIGTLAFSFPRWRFDCEGQLEVSEKGQRSFSKSLLEQAGFARVLNRQSDVYVDSQTGAETQFLGRGFVRLPGSGFEGGYWKTNRDGKRKLVSIDATTFVELRRAYLLVSNHNGSLLIRNSSTVFGRNTFKYPAYYSPRGYSERMTVKQLLSLTPENINDFGFKHILAPSLYKNTLQRDPEAMTKLLDQLQTVLEGYSRWKFDTHFDSAWDRTKSGEAALLGGYSSAGFRSLVRLLERRQEDITMDMLIEGETKQVMPDLAICRTDFVPWVPDDRLQVTPDVLRALRHLADHGLTGFGEFAGTRVRNFIDYAMQQQGELVLLAPEKRRNT